MHSCTPGTHGMIEMPFYGIAYVCTILILFGSPLPPFWWMARCCCTLVMHNNRFISRDSKTKSVLTIFSPLLPLVFEMIFGPSRSARTQHTTKHTDAEKSAYTLHITHTHTGTLVSQQIKTAKEQSLPGHTQAHTLSHPTVRGTSLANFTWINYAYVGFLASLFPLFELRLVFIVQIRPLPENSTWNFEIFKSDSFFGDKLTHTATANEEH